MNSVSAGTRSPVSRTRWTMLIVHALIVAILTGAEIVLMANTPADWGATDASIVLGLLVLPLLALGLPWSIVYFVVIFSGRLPSMDDISGLQLFGMNFAMLAPAVLNVVIHALWLFSARRRHLRSA